MRQRAAKKQAWSQCHLDAALQRRMSGLELGTSERRESPCSRVSRRRGAPKEAFCSSEMEGDCGPFAARYKAGENVRPIDAIRSGQIGRFEQIAKRQQAINERMVAELCVGNTVQELALPARDRKACAFDAQLNSMITNLRSCEKATILNVQRLDMQFDRRYGSRPAERRVVMVRRKAGIAELRIAVGLQDRRASGHSLSGHQGIDIEHHAHGRVGIEISRGGSRSP